VSDQNNARNGLAVDRRAMLMGIGATAAASGFSLSSQPAFAQRGLSSVPIEKLMAKSDLPDLTIGKPDAKVTIVEYASMTCPACANFHNTTFPKIKEKYVDTGKVFFVMREFPLDNLAAAVSMLTRCAGSDKAVSFIAVLFKTQAQWRIRNPVPKLFEIAKQVGFTQKSFDKCLEDSAMLEKLIKQREKASKVFGVDATPSFFINGKRLRGRSTGIEAFDAVLEPLLKG